MEVHFTIVSTRVYKLITNFLQPSLYLIQRCEGNILRRLKDFSLLQVIVIANFVNFAPLTYESSSMGKYVYPSWANSVGWCIVASSMSIVPLMAIYQILTAPGSLKQVENLY